jgi:hypothetical protein
MMVTAGFRSSHLGRRSMHVVGIGGGGGMLLRGEADKENEMRE